MGREFGKKWAKTKKVICPACEHGYTTVVDTRRSKRLRRCDACAACWLTDEVFARYLPRGTSNIPSKDLVDSHDI